MLDVRLYLVYCVTGAIGLLPRISRRREHYGAAVLPTHDMLTLGTVGRFKGSKMLARRRASCIMLLQLGVRCVIESLSRRLWCVMERLCLGICG